MPPGLRFFAGGQLLTAKEEIVLPYAQFALYSFIAMFLLVLAVILIVIIGQRYKNSRAPRLSVRAEVIKKRAQVTRHLHWAPSLPHSQKRVTYYVTFAIDGGQQLELWVRRQVYQQLKQNCRGTLTFQGTQYLDFQKAPRSR